MLRCRRPGNNFATLLVLVFVSIAAFLEVSQEHGFGPCLEQSLEKTWTATRDNNRWWSGEIRDDRFSNSNMRVAHEHLVCGNKSVEAIEHTRSDHNLEFTACQARCCFFEGDLAVEQQATVHEHRSGRVVGQSLEKGLSQLLSEGLFHVVSTTAKEGGIEESTFREECTFPEEALALTTLAMEAARRMPMRRSKLRGAPAAKFTMMWVNRRMRWCFMWP